MVLVMVASSWATGEICTGVLSFLGRQEKFRCDDNNDDEDDDDSWDSSKELLYSPVLHSAKHPVFSSWLSAS